MADHDPQQPVGGSPLAQAAPNDDLKAVYERGKALRQPAAPLSPQEIVGHLRSVSATPPGQQSLWDCTVAAWAADAIEAQAAEIKRLTAYSRHQYSLGHEAACIEVGGELDVLRAENARLASENADIRTMIADPQAVHLGMLRGGIAKPSLRNMLHLHGDEAIKRWDEADALKAEVERLNGQIGAWMVTASQDAFRAQTAETQLRELGAQYLADFGQRYQPECYATTDHGWYTAHRRRVEADHAAAEEAKRQAECRNCRDGRPVYVDPSDWDTCPDCGKKFGAAAKEAAQ